MINIFKILILFFFASKCFALNIDNSVKGVIENNPKVKIAIEKLKESKELINYAAGYKLPLITSSISGKYSNSETNTLTSSTSPEIFTDEYKITITQNIYDFGFNNLEIERSKILFNSELIQFKITIQNLIMDAINGYLTVINYEKSLEATTKNYDSVFKALEESRTRFDIGSATLYDLQNSQASYALAKTNLYAAEQNLIISKKTFERIVGLSPSDLNESIKINQSINLNKIIEKAMINNLNLNLISNDIKNKEILILKEKKSKKPSLDIVGIGLYSNGSRLENGTNNTNGSISLNLTIPLYQKNQDNSNIRKYNSQLLQAKFELEDYKYDLQILISNTFKDFKINKSQMESNLIIIKSIQTALSSLIEEYNMGTKTISELIEQEEKLLEAKVNFLNSNKNNLLNYFKLKSLDGTLINLFENYLPSHN